mmetsp:Transcript_6032/g.10713  ORF Transcript_6032/g.10713 Transcript_6032/m.10713 type:complete len:247 (+) Transcript_6032:1356-2096(+)
MLDNASIVRAPPFTKTPRRAHALRALRYATGAPIINAHGLAATRNPSARLNEPFDPNTEILEPANREINGSETAIRTEHAMITCEYVLPNRSRNPCSFGRFCCASVTSRTILEIVLSAPTRNTFTTKELSRVRAPAGISSPSLTDRGSCSPVICSIATYAVPPTTMQSHGASSPAFTNRISSTITSSTDTVSEFAVFPFVSGCFTDSYDFAFSELALASLYATLGASSCSASRSPLARSVTTISAE